MNNSFVKAQLSILSRTDLNAMDKLLYSLIANLDNENHCIASRQYLSDSLGTNIRTISRSLKHLRELGLISVKFGKGYRMTITVAEVAQNEPSELQVGQNVSARQDKLSRLGGTKCLGSIYNTIYTNNSQEKKSIEEKIYKNKGKGNAIDSTKQASNNNKRSHAEEDSDLDHQLSTAMQKYLESSDTIMGTPTDVVYDKLIYLATTFEERYKERFGNPHPSLRADDLFSPMGECISNLFTGKKTIADVTKPDLDAMIDKYFETKYREGCDYHFPHFCRTEIWINRLHEVERESGRGGFYGISTAEKNEVKDVIDVIDRWYEDYSSEQTDEAYGERDTLIHAEYCP